MKLKAKYIYKNFAHYSPFMLYLLTIGMLMSIILLWYFFLIKPIRQFSNYYALTTIQHCTRIQSVDHLKKQTIVFNNSCNKLKKEINDYKGHLLPDQLVSIFNKIQDMNVLLKECSLIGEQKKEWYTKKTMNFVVEATYINIINFLKSLSDRQSLINCESLILEKSQTNEIQAHCIFSTISLNQGAL